MEMASEKDKLRVDMLHRSFYRSEQQLMFVLHKRKADVKVTHSIYLSACKNLLFIQI